MQIKIETQGLSEDYQAATGSFDSISRGELPLTQIEKIVRQIQTLSAPSGDEVCPPSLYLPRDGIVLFAVGGQIRCLDSRQETMTVEEAMQIISGELTLAEFDAKYGHKSRVHSFKALIVAVCLVLLLVGGWQVMG